MRFLYDTSIFVYARGAEHEHREPCRDLVRLAAQGVLTGEASVELIQEYAHILRRRGLDETWVREQAWMSPGCACCTTLVRMICGSP